MTRSRRSNRRNESRREFYSGLPSTPSREIRASVQRIIDCLQQLAPLRPSAIRMLESLAGEMCRVKRKSDDVGNPEATDDGP